MTPEGKVKAAVSKVLSKYSGLYSLMPVQNGMGAATLDYLVCYRGQFIGIETKAPGKKPTPRQKTTIAKLQAAGAVVFVIDDVAGTGPLDDFLRGRNSTHWEALNNEPDDPD